ncbi:MAG TPA: hypothetical protein VKR30_10610 [Candidatus Limnocylindrales bacterium]|nr:hypothetical protein [Candidatus Limnocylindrales bacterium]
MRGCLGFLLFLVVAVGLLGYAVVQYAIPAVVTAAVRSSPLARGQNLTVQVDTSLTGVFLHGSVDRIAIGGANVTEPNATISLVDITLADVSILDRTFASATGTLTGVSVDLSDGSPIQLTSVAVSGSSSSLQTAVDLTAAEASIALRDRLRAAGIPADSVQLVRGGVDIVVAGRTIPARVVVTAGSVSLDAGPPYPAVTVFSAPAGGDWTIGSVDVSATGIRVTVAISLG